MQNIDTFLTLDVYDYDLTPSTIKAIALDSNTRSVTHTKRYCIYHEERSTV